MIKNIKGYKTDELDLNKKGIGLCYVERDVATRDYMITFKFTEPIFIRIFRTSDPLVFIGELKKNELMLLRLSTADQKAEVVGFGAKARPLAEKHGLEVLGFVSSKYYWEKEAENEE